jgi:hypothetical protein
MFNNIKVSMESIRSRKRAQREENMDLMIRAVLDGAGGNYPDESFNPVWLARGIEIEMEHTSYPMVAKIIAKQHLTEHPDYYFYLIRMEKEMKS